MYLGLIAVTAGAALVSAFVLPEEEFLHRELGAAYAAHARRVPRWLPFRHA
jgi:protein-S-isoprenylcysteine O-methyltransferase Ste14